MSLVPLGEGCRVGAPQRRAHYQNLWTIKASLSRGAVCARLCLHRHSSSETNIPLFLLHRHTQTHTHTL